MRSVICCCVFVCLSASAEGDSSLLVKVGGAGLNDDQKQNVEHAEKQTINPEDSPEDASQIVSSAE